MEDPKESLKTFAAEVISNLQNDDLPSAVRTYEKASKVLLPEQYYSLVGVARDWFVANTTFDRAKTFRRHIKRIKPQQGFVIRSGLTGQIKPRKPLDHKAEMREFDRVIEDAEIRYFREKKEAEERLAAERREAEVKLVSMLEPQYLDVLPVFRSQFPSYASDESFRKRRIAFVQHWIEQKLPPHPDIKNRQVDEDQACAIGSVNDHTLVQARAGSGKTETLVNRAFFLHRHCGVQPDEILLLVFNKKAAEEMRQRIAIRADIAFPHVMTFHALAYALVHPDHVVTDEIDGQDEQSGRIQKFIDEHLRDQDLMPEIRSLMLDHFRGDWETVLAKLEPVREIEVPLFHSLPRVGLDGWRYRSWGEKRIANFLFEHGLEPGKGYRYEQRLDWYDWETYRPDFTIPTDPKEETGVVIEYFGMESTGDSNYDNNAQKKRKWWSSSKRGHKGWRLVGVSRQEVARQDEKRWREIMRGKLEPAGVSLLPHPQTDEVLASRIERKSGYRFTGALKTFIGRSRKRSWSADDLEREIAAHTPVDEIERRFLRVAAVIYHDYLADLRRRREMDFDGLVDEAVARIRQGQTQFQRTVKHGDQSLRVDGDLRRIQFLLVDEFQDFSELFHRMVEAIRTQSPAINVFCVGDDWQSINGFAGSELRYFTDFDKDYQGHLRLSLETNYRSAQAIVAAGDDLMKKKDDIRTRANRADEGFKRIGNVAHLTPTTAEWYFHRDPFLSALLRVVHQAMTTTTGKVMLLSRTATPNIWRGWWKYKNWHCPGCKERDCDDRMLYRLRCVARSMLPAEERDRLQGSTVHSFKGKEAETIILLDAGPQAFPLIHPDNVFNRIFYRTGQGMLSSVVEEELRLLYVAISRATDRLYLLVDAEKPDDYSPFLPPDGLWPTLREWADLPPMPRLKGEPLILCVGNQDGSTAPKATEVLRNALTQDKDEDKYKYRYPRFEWIKPLWRKESEIEPFLADFSRRYYGAQGILARFETLAGKVIARYEFQDGVACRVD